MEPGASRRSRVRAVWPSRRRPVFYTPTCAVVDQRGEIMYMPRQPGNYLEPTTGQPSHNILQLTREGLRLHVAAALRKAGASAPDAGPRQGLIVVSIESTGGEP